MYFAASERETIFQVVRQLVYFAIMVCGALMLWVLTGRYRTATFWEFGIVENIQLTILLLTTGVFLANAFILKQNKGLFIFLACFCLFACCRELDNYLNEKLPIIGWKFGYLFPLTGLGMLLRDRKQARNIFFQFLRTPAFQMMGLVIMMLIIAEILGHRPLIEKVYGKRIDSRVVRRIFEEGIEYMAYILLLVSSVESYFNFSKKK